MCIAKHNNALVFSYGTHQTWNFQVQPSHSVLNISNQSPIQSLQLLGLEMNNPHTLIQVESG